MKELRGKTAVLLGLHQPSASGELKQQSDSQVGAIVWVRGETFKAESETADLWQPKWNKNQTVLVVAIHTLERDAECGDGGSIPGQGLLLPAERWIEKRWGIRLWWERPVEQSRAAMEARQYCWVMCRGWSHHHSLSLPTRQHLKLNNREAGPLNAWSTELQSRTPARAPL